MPRRKDSYVTNRETEQSVETPSDLSSRVNKLEEGQNKITDLLQKLIDKQSEPPKLPRVQSPDAKIEAFKAAKVGGEPVTRRTTKDLLYPQAEAAGFQNGQIIQLLPTSEKYPAYKLDNEGFPVKQIMEYQCQACAQTEPCKPLAISKKICPACGKTMLKMPTGKYEEGSPAYGVVLNYMYTSRKGGRKYKVQFEKFGTDGLLENEMAAV